MKENIGNWNRQLTIKTKRLLDSLERKFKYYAKEILLYRVNRFFPMLDQIMSSKKIPSNDFLPGEQLYDVFFRQYVNTVAKNGVWMAGVQQNKLENHSENHYDLPDSIYIPREIVDPEYLVEPEIPPEVKEDLDQRLSLQGKWKKAFEAMIVLLIYNALSKGTSTPDLKNEIVSNSVDFFKARFDLISSIETMNAYNMAQVSAYKSSGVVGGFQFLAVLDERTSDICRARHGLILPAESDLLLHNIPPLHMRCRSVLGPVLNYQMTLLRAGDPDAEKMFFGGLSSGDGFMAPSSLSESIDLWKHVPPPQIF